MKKPNFKKLTGKSVVQRALIPVGCALLGGVAGSAVGGPWNLVGAAATAATGIAMDNQNILFAAAGMAVVTPPKTAATVSGLDGLPELAAAAKNRALSYVKGKLSNAKLDFVADKIPVSGLSGLDEVGDAYEMGYQDGVDQAVGELMEGEEDEMAGPYNYGGNALLMAGSSQTISPEAARIRQMMGTM